MEAASSLMRLPRELRDNIYSHVASAEEAVRLKSRLCDTASTHVIARSGLLITSKQVHREYNEALLKPVLFGTLQLTVVTTDYNTSPLHTFASTFTTPQLATFVKNAQVHLETAITSPEAAPGSLCKVFLARDYTEHFHHFCEKHRVSILVPGTIALSSTSDDLIASFDRVRIDSPAATENLDGVRCRYAGQLEGADKTSYRFFRELFVEVNAITRAYREADRARTWAGGRNDGGERWGLSPEAEVKGTECTRKAPSRCRSSLTRSPPAFVWRQCFADAFSIQAALLSHDFVTWILSSAVHHAD